jgi:hypothetical protein
MERFTDVLPVRLVDPKAAADPLSLAVAACGKGKVQTVPVFTVIRATEEEPDCAPAASLRVRRSPFSQPPWQRVPTASGVSRPTARRVRAAPGPDPSGSSWRLMKGCLTPVPRVLLSIPLAGPRPSGSTGQFRLCQGCSRPPRHHPDQDALSSAVLLRRDQRRRSLTSTRTTAPHGARTCSGTRS